MTETRTRGDSRPVPVAFPSISRNPNLAIPIIVALHGPLDFLTAYWMMSVRGTAIEWNPIASAAFEHGTLAYAAFTIGGTIVLATLLWVWRQDLWDHRWSPPIAEILIFIGVFGLVGANTLAALGVAF